jgi:low temperature requirement protein LtrA
MTMANWRWRDIGRAPADRVTTVEVFFDLVFVFTLTQLTRILETGLSLRSGGQVLLLFGLLWWMFSGYVWLANHVPPRAPLHKLVLFCGMAGFLIAAVGVPLAFSSTGLVFGIGYLVVISVHLVLFTQADIDRTVLGRLAAYNLVSAALVVLGGIVDGRSRYALWLAALLMQWVVPSLMPRYSWVGLLSSFHIATGHFIERLGLLVIIALGESVVAIGVAVDVAHLTAGTVAVMVLALALPGGLWWAYFTDTASAETTMNSADPARRVRLALAMGYAHVPLLLGIVVTAAGIHAAVAHPGSVASWSAALALGGGIALSLCGIAAIRHTLHAAPIRSRLIVAAAALATAPVGALVNAAAQVALVALVLVTMLLTERRYHAEQAALEG